MATLKDIAKITGLSTSSISRVLNGDESLNISNEKKRLILKTAEDLNYKTVNVRRQTDGQILIICSLSEQEEFNDPYYISIRVGAENYCIQNKQKFKTIYFNQINDTNLNSFTGIIIIGQLSEESFIPIGKSKLPIVFADANSKNQEYNCVTVDLRHITKIALDKLYSSGAKNILYVGPFAENTEYDIRYSSFRSYMSFNNKEGYYLETSFDTLDVYTKLLSFNGLKEIDGIFCANDNIAIGVLKYLQEAKINVPTDIQLVGVNDLPICEKITPKLTTVRIHSDYIGEVAVRRLLELLINETEHRMNYVVHSKLIERETTR
ncbi:MAG: LacI family DNA-binding transcriptional regulator [Bacilli bacterium]